MSDATIDDGGELSTDEMSAGTRWLLLEGDRRLLALGILVAVGCVLAGLLWSGVVAVSKPGPLARLFSALVGGNLTLITVVISINQLILSREFSGPGEIRERIDKMIEYRHAIEAVADAEVSPVSLEKFLDFLAIELRGHAEQLQTADADHEDQRQRDAVDAYAGALVRQADEIRTALEERPSGAFHTLMTILDTDLTADLYEAERLRGAYATSLPPSAADALDDTYDLLAYTGVARQYFKSIYMQRELTELSRLILYTGLPAVVVSILAVWLYGHPVGPVLPRAALQVTVVLASVIALSPLAVLAAYLLRITTITRRTASLMPFEIHEQGPL